MVRLYLIRHGQSEDNVVNISVSYPDTVAPFAKQIEEAVTGIPIRPHFRQ